MLHTKLKTRTHHTSNIVNMGKHKEWRKNAKKTRRKRIRTKKAKERDEEIAIEESSEEFLAWQTQQQMAEEALEREEQEYLKKREMQWLEDELRAQQEFRLKALERAKYDEELAKQKEALKAEIAAREARKKAENEAKEAQKLQLEAEAKEREQKIEDFLQKGGELPAELRIASESNPHKEVCPFFTKVAACRFGEQCSRNHIHPAISNCILLPGMFSHPSLGANSSSAGDQQDWNLEDFFQDVSTELASHGDLVRLVVCFNAEVHLRGNVYAQFASERDALKVCRALVGRWYAGRRLQPQFVTIPNWKSAICGLQDIGRCPKGRNCNFIHMFRNPGGQFTHIPTPRPPPRESSVRRRRRHRSRSLSPWQSSPKNRSPSSWSVRSQSRNSRSPTPRIRGGARSRSRSLSPWDSSSQASKKSPSKHSSRHSSRRKRSRSREKSSKRSSRDSRSNRSRRRRKSSDEDNRRHS
ncbi:hypothetical protein B566_EDAN005282 [Ephemera danica]|nr:hypothetical protein B566_EDAN005282 [Ephemera danica]